VEFSGNNSGKAQPIRTKILQGNVVSGETLAWKISVLSIQRPHDGGKKDKLFCQDNNTAFGALPGGQFL